MKLGQDDEKQRQKGKRAALRQRNLGLVSWVTAMGAVFGFFGTWQVFTHTASSNAGTGVASTTSTNTANPTTYPQSTGVSDGVSSQWGGTTQNPNYGGSVSVHPSTSTGSVVQSGAS